MLQAAFWCALLAVFLTPMELGDVWWHLSTGQWIWQHMTLPDIDPFSYTQSTHDAQFVLKGFWISQCLLYIVHSAAGIYGLIALKSICFTSMLAITYRSIRAHGTHPLIGHMLLLPVAFIATFYDEARPQTLALPLYALTILILESSSRPESPKTYKLLPVAMIVWANMYPGFALGIAFIGLYACAHIIEEGVFRKAPLNWDFIGFCALAVAASFINPNGIESLRRLALMIMPSQAGKANIHEHASVAEFSAFTSQPGLEIALHIMIALLFLSFLARRKRPEALAILTATVLSVATFMTYRAGIYFAPIAAIIIGRNLSGITPAKCINGPVQKWLAMGAIPLVIAFLLVPRSVFMKPALDKNIIPTKIADYILTSNTPPNIYHPYEWGGYFTWRLVPEYKVFIDGRAIGPMREHSGILMAKENWKAITEKYNINTIVYWPLLPYTGEVPQIIFALMRDEGWQPVYWDLQGIAFVRSELAHKAIGKNAIWELLTSLVMANISNSPASASHYSTLGEIYLHRGLKREAGAAFSRALEIDPADRRANSWMKVLQ